MVNQADIVMAKKEYRRLAGILRKEHSSDPRPDFAAAVARMDLFKRATCVAMYMPMASEPDIGRLRDVCRLSGKRVLVPVSDGAGAYRFSHIAPDALLRIGAFGVEEPEVCDYAGGEEADICLVPGVLFDKSGNRLGHGRGYYDRLLTSLRCDCVKIGVAFSWQIVPKLPCEPHDVLMDEILSL